MTQQPNKPQDEMTPANALQILDQAVQLAPLTRMQHVTIQTAVQVIARRLQAANQMEATADVAQKAAPQLK